MKYFRKFVGKFMVNCFKIVGNCCSGKLLQNCWQMAGKMFANCLVNCCQIIDKLLTNSSTLVSDCRQIVSRWLDNCLHIVGKCKTNHCLIVAKLLSHCHLFAEVFSRNFKFSPWCFCCCYCLFWCCFISVVVIFIVIAVFLFFLSTWLGRVA